MTNLNLDERIAELKELEAMAKQINEEAEAIKDEIKAELNRRQTAEVTTVHYTVRYKEVTSSRFDSKSFKAEHSELYKAYTKESTSKRFTIS